MATGTYKGDVFTLQETPVIATLPRAALAGGIVYATVDRLIASTAGGLDAGTTIHVAKLPKNAVVLYSLVYPITTALFDKPATASQIVDGSLGITDDTDLFGDVEDLNNSALPQVVVPIPDGDTYTDRLDPLEESVDVFFTSASAVLTDAEGIVVQMFYTVAGQI